MNADKNNTLRNSNDPTENYLGEILYYLKKVRGFADYDWDKKDINYFKKIFRLRKEYVKQHLFID